MVKQQSEVFYVSLPKGVKEKRVNILGRSVTLTNGDAHSGIVVKTFPEYFTPNFTQVDTITSDQSGTAPSQSETTSEQLLVDDSSDVSVEKQPASEAKPKVGRPKKDKEQ